MPAPKSFRTVNFTKSWAAFGCLCFATLFSALPAQEPEISAIELGACELSGSGGFRSIEARCGRLSVPENPERPAAKRIDLFIAIIPAHDLEPARDAFTFLAGGPGQAASTAFVDAAHAFDAIRKRRDIVLVDQRGTGKSAALECAREQDLLGGVPASEQLLKEVRSCLDALQADPRYYTTSVAVKDLEKVRIALGYEQFNVYGGSYGTRVGLHYLRKYPRSVRTLIIDGVVPADMSLGPGISIAAQHALDNVFARCDGAPECSGRFGNLRAQFETLQSALREAAVTVSLSHPVNGRQDDVLLDYDRFAVAIRLLSYAPDSVALLPLLLHQAATVKHLGPLAAQAIMMEEFLTRSLSFGMHNSVVCTEDVPFYIPDQIDRDALHDTYLGVSQLDLLETICQIWPAGVIDSDFKEAVVSDLPILLLSGSADPVTPPAYAEHAAQTLTDHLHLVGEDMGHILAPVGCVPRLIARYVDQASLVDIDTTCVEQISPMPFFTSFNGPQP